REDLHPTFDGAVGEHDRVRAEGFLERTERLAGGGGKVAFDVHGDSPGGRRRPLLDVDYRQRASIARVRIKRVSRAYSADDAAGRLAAAASIARSRLRPPLHGTEPRRLLSERRQARTRWRAA